MKSVWNDLSLKARIEESNAVKVFFKNRVIKAYLERESEPFTPTNKELAELCKLPEHAVKRYLKYWKSKGVFTTSNKRYRHQSYGWCNRRTIDVHPTYAMAVTALIRSGRIL